MCLLEFEIWKVVVGGRLGGVRAVERDEPVFGLCAKKRPHRAKATAYASARNAYLMRLSMDRKFAREPTRADRRATRDYSRGQAGPRGAECLI
jgi:hypothetical protein